MRYSIEFYKKLSVGQVLYGINNICGDGVYQTEKYTIEEIEFLEKINKSGSDVRLYKIRTKKQDYTDKYIDDVDQIFLTENEVFDGSKYVLRLEKILHSTLSHPDYEYEENTGPRKDWDIDPPEGEGWETNVDYHDGWERFDYHEEAYWRRKKPPKKEIEND